jgi:hypothetical protein
MIRGVQKWQKTKNSRAMMKLVLALIAGGRRASRWGKAAPKMGLPMIRTYDRHGPAEDELS